jgi:tRNA modification GTPase
VIEDEMILGGISFRFMDTAGLRDTTDTVEAIGVERTHERIRKASLVLYVFDLAQSLEEILKEAESITNLNVPVIKVGNKMDKANAAAIEKLEANNFILISASQKQNIQKLKDKVLSHFHVGEVKQGDVLVTNLRHYQNLKQTNDALDRVLEGMGSEITGDFLAMDIRQALHYLGEITGQVTTDDLLDNIFSKFCIGK